MLVASGRRKPIKLDKVATSRFKKRSERIEKEFKEKIRRH